MPVNWYGLNKASNVQMAPVGNLSSTDLQAAMMELDTEKLSISNAFMSGYKNKIINGNFDIWQRGTSQTTSGYGSADRWGNTNTGSTKTHSQQSFVLGQTDVPGNPKFFSRTFVSSVTGANNMVIKHQNIEGVRTLSGSTSTLSFWAKADANRQMAIEFYQSFGGGGSPSAPVSGIAAQKISLTSSWQKFTITANIPSIAGKTLGTDGNDTLMVLFWFDAGSNFNARTASLGHQSGTFDIAQVQLEEGSIATSFESRHIAQELALCQRYYETTYPIGTAPGTNMGTNYSSLYRVLDATTPYASLSWVFKVTKRQVPTCHFYGSDGAIDRITATGVGNYSLTYGFPSFHSYANFINAASVPGTTGLCAYGTADAEL